MKNTEALKNKLLQLQSEVNANPLHNIEFKQQKKDKKNMSFVGGNGRIYIQPFHSEYDISLSGISIEKQMYQFMCDLCGKREGYKHKPRQAFWRVTDFKLVEKAVYHYAKTQKTK
jgi:hypothetical protein